MGVPFSGFLKWWFKKAVRNRALFRRTSGVLALWLLAGATAAANAADSLALSLPLDCRPGVTCWVANYFDHGAGTPARDYRCGSRTYDGHDGTDFAVRDREAMRVGVTIRAAAAGRVRAIRDGVADGDGQRAGEDRFRGQECGNGVLIEHQGNWQTQYCHLKRGSILVAAGQMVQGGTALGLVGLSGRTEFPHLHFTIRRDGRAIDPFAPGGQPEGCTAPDTKSMAWAEVDAAAMAYVNGAIHNLGIAPDAPTVEAVRSGVYANVHTRPVERNAAVLAPFVEIFGLLEGDTVRLSLSGPTGETLAAREVLMSAPQARWSGFVGRNRPAAGWQPGTYVVRASVSRLADSATATGRELSFEVR